MPFITNATAVSGFSSGPIPAATAGSAGAFTVTITASCGPSAFASSLASTGETRGQMAADGTGAIHANPHLGLLRFAASLATAAARRNQLPACAKHSRFRQTKGKRTLKILIAM